MSRPRLALALVLTVLALAVPAPAAADDTICTGTLGSTTHDNVRVPDDATCRLDGTRVEGNVFVGTRARLDAAGARIDGNVQAEGATDVAVRTSRIGGSVQLEQGGSAAVTDNTIDADLQLESNGGALDADGNTIGGNLQAVQNTGGLSITGNTIDGNLQCKENDPAPVGGGNVVRGNAEDQCAQLAGGDDTTPGTGRATARLGGANRYETAVAITRAAFPDGADVVYLARADGFADALAGGNLSDGPVLLVPSCGTVPGVVLAEIRRLDPTRVVALGGSAAVCHAVLEAAADA